MARLSYSPVSSTVSFELFFEAERTFSCNFDCSRSDGAHSSESPPHH